MSIEDKTKWYSYLNPMFWIRRLIYKLIQRRIEKEMIKLFSGVGSEVVKDLKKDVEYEKG